MRPQGRSGHFLVEFAVLLPVLLSVVAGGYALCRRGFLDSSCQSLAQSLNLRAGRRQSMPEDAIRRALPADLDRASRESRPEKGGGALPVRMPGLTGRTTSKLRWEKTWNEAGGYATERSAEIVRSATAHVDCWDAGSPSGKRIRTFVDAAVATGILR